MPLIEVFRVENTSGIGPYAADYGDAVGLDIYHNPRAPKPSWDGLPSVRIEDRFGFASIEQLLDWFDMYLDNLRDHEYRVVKISVHQSRVKYGRKQLMFREYKNWEARRVVIPWQTVKELV